MNPQNNMQSIRPVPTQHAQEALRQISIGGSTIADVQVSYFQSKLANYPNAKLIWAGYDNQDKPKNVIAFLPQPGRTGLLFTSQPTGPRGATALAQIIETALEQIPLPLVNLAQAITRPQDDLQLTAYLHASFTQLAQLNYMRADIPDEAAPPTLPPGVTLEPYTHALRPQFARTLELSYHDTLDCPALQGLRDTDDIIKGHMAVGDFDPRLWTLLLVDDQPAGCLLLNPINAIDSIELAYLGISPAHRGKRLANLLMQHALHQTATRPQSHFTLAMDDRNAPAQTLYRNFGFITFDKRVALIRSLKDI